MKGFPFVCVNSQELTIEIFADQNLVCGEGPVWNAVNETLFWTDSGGDEIYFSPTGDSARIFSKGTRAASAALHSDGGLMCCGNHSFFHVKPNGYIRMFDGMADGIKTEMLNDIVIDARGRAIAGQESFTDETPDKTGYLFSMDLNGTIRIIDEGFHLANGMGFSPANDKFYLADTIPGRIYEYDYNLASGHISNKKDLISIPKDRGLPDGVTVDSEGFIWVALWFGHGISRFDPDGKLERTISLPASQITSLTFGGKDLNHLFITSASIQWKTPLAPSGENYSTYRGGRIYRIIQDIQGKNEYTTNIE